MFRKKNTDSAKQLVKQFNDVGFAANVLVDDDGLPVCAWAWSKDIVVTKIDLDKSKTKNRK